MRSPASMSVIQIDVTNACQNTCSNCTRFCGNHRKTFFMDLEYYKKAVDSLADFPGLTGMIGGEPTMHPEFQAMSQYVGKMRQSKPLVAMRTPIHDVNEIMQRVNANTCRGAGLWSTVNTKHYYKYFEVISNTYDYQILNDHANECEHQGLLMARKDFNIPDDEFYKLRDACWIQNSWSATITPKGAFFCEVAGALDMLFDGPGGWDISDKNWWKRTPDEFGDQLNWCELCGCALDSPRRLSHDGRDDISQTLYNKLVEVKSPKIKRGNYVLHSTLEGKAFTHGNEYMGNRKRLAGDKTKKVLCPHSVHTAKVTDTLKSIEETVQGNKDWVWVSLKNKRKYPEQLKTLIFNPGCLYIIEEDCFFFNLNAMSLKDADYNSLCDLQSLLKIYPPYNIIKVSKEDASIIYENRSVLELKYYMYSFLKRVSTGKLSQRYSRKQEKYKKKLSL